MQSSFSIAEAAKLTGFPGGRQKFYTYLRDSGIILSGSTEPFQRHVDEGRMIYTMKRVPFKVVCVPRVTIKGIAYLKQKITRDFKMCKCCGKPLIP